MVVVKGVCACHYVDYTFFAQFANGKCVVNVCHASTSIDCYHEYCDTTSL